MCRLKQWHPKSPWRNIHSQEPRAPKSCSIRAPIRAPKSCSIRVPDSGPEKSYTIRAPKRWLVDTNVWPSKSPWRNIHSQEPRSTKSCSIRAPIRAPKSCSFRVPDLGPEELFDSGPDSGPEKLFHSGPGFGPRKAVPFGPRVLFSSWKNSPCWLRRLVQNLGRVQAPKLPQREQGTVAQWQRARTNLRTRSW